MAATAVALRMVARPGFEYDPDAEATIRSLRDDCRKGFAKNANDPTRDIRYVASSGIYVLPVWDEGVIVEYEVLVSAGTIKP